MKRVTFIFAHDEDIRDLLNCREFAEMIKENQIKALYDSYLSELTIVLKDPFDAVVLRAVFDLVNYYANYN